MPAGPEALPREARAAVDEYLAALDAALPRIARGIYVTGSAVLGDWQPRRSDLDILTVTERRLTGADMDALDALHAGIPGRPYRDAMYIPAEAVGKRGAGPADPAGRYPSAVDGVFHRARYRPDPVLWATLDRHGLTLRGPAASSSSLVYAINVPNHAPILLGAMYISWAGSSRTARRSAVGAHQLNVPRLRA